MCYFGSLASFEFANDESDELTKGTDAEITNYMGWRNSLRLDQSGLYSSVVDTAFICVFRIIVAITRYLTGILVGLTLTNLS